MSFLKDWSDMMLPKLTNYIFYIESLILSNGMLDNPSADFINNNSPNSCYFFTHDCDISRTSLYNKLLENNIKCNPHNVMTPNYLLLKYCKNLYRDFSVYPIKETDDFMDFTKLNIPIDYENPDIIFLSTKNLSDKDLSLIENTSIPIVLSSNLCFNRLYGCSYCSNTCILHNITNSYKNRIIIPDLPPLYNSFFLFKQLNIQPKHTTIITDLLRDDYMQYQRCGCKIILNLSNRTNYEDYLKSPYDANLVVSNFDNLSYFLNAKKKD